MRQVDVDGVGQVRIEIDEYQGNPVVRITELQAKNPRFAKQICFGSGKARMVLAALTEVKQLAQE